MPLLKTEVSKVDYASKARSSNVRGVGTFFDACLNLGQFSYAYLKICIVIYPDIWILKLYPSIIVWDFLRPVLKSVWNFCHSQHIKTYK